MKKLTYLLFIFAFALSSCGKSSPEPEKPDDVDNGTPPNEVEETLLPAKIVSKTGGETRTYTLNYKEDSRELTNIKRSDGKIQNFIYENGRIKKKYDGTVESESDFYDEFTYENGKLLKVKETRGDKNEEQSLITLQYVGTKKIITAQEAVNKMEIELEYNDKGNPIQAKVAMNDNPMGQMSMNYDNTKSPFLNVAGWDLIRFLPALPMGDNIDFEDVISTGNNMTKATGNIEGQSASIDYQYEFKDERNNAFPTKIKGVRKLGNDSENFEVEITYK